MYDDEIRSSVADLAVPTFDSTPFVQPLALEDARVAIVTTAGLTPDSGEIWRRGDEGFRVLEGAPESLQLGHASQNVDRIAFEYDHNVVFPVDRLQELARDGVIGSVADRHLSFMGAQHGTLRTIQLDTGPKAARVLLDAGVDVAILTPI